ncbi:MAG: rod shape-determining protein MreC [Desulfobacteraceae bacterium]|jgi:rod shape-determining protein MreC|nr:rod shape-determining protein MreC [Desulfobacteraceae bacterium]MDH3874329.1 rod shape-determining protein MreC [Desulfobacteraceae bacterium]MDH3955073.1 rod shape-determining protein MreC [Desulfobacteraceae bacterium]
MFSKKMVMIIGVIVLIAVNIILLSVFNRTYISYYRPGRIAISLIAPFQKASTSSIRFVRDIWRHYFFVVNVAKENDNYQKALNKAFENNIQLKEFELSNSRLRNLLNFKKTITDRVLSAEVIGKDPSPWFKTVLIDKGENDGVETGMAVVVPKGIAGQVTDVSANYSKVLLIIDHNSAVDALVQNDRARGIIQGDAAGQCLFKYVLRKHDIKIGDIVVSSGLDGVFPKGLAVGYVSAVIKPKSGIFQDVTVSPYVDFEKLEEVLIVLNPKKQEFEPEQ